jgi:DNA-binding NarL/FixJ family response regulator
MDNPLSVIVVDDQAPFRLAARAVVRRTEGFKLVGEAANGIEAISLANSLHPDLVLMDINVPEMGGLEATRQIVAGHPGTIVFLCSTYDVNDLPEDARTSGARAYMHKEHFSPNTLRRLWDERDSGRFAS